MAYKPSNCNGGKRNDKREYLYRFWRKSAEHDVSILTAQNVLNTQLTKINIK